MSNTIEKSAANKQGTVVKISGKKTIRLQILERFRHPKYLKVISRTSSIMAHDENEVAKVGDVVRVEQHRPYSRKKGWLLKDVVRVAVG